MYISALLCRLLIQEILFRWCMTGSIQPVMDTTVSNICTVQTGDMEMQPQKFLYVHPKHIPYLTFTVRIHTCGKF